MSGYGFLMIGIGAACGAWSRWLLGVSFNAIFANIPLGTLVANLVGGYLIGLLVGAINLGVQISPEIRLLLATGFLGGLTTFSTFSAEAVGLLLKGQWGVGLVHVALHLFGSLLMTALGIYSAKLIIG